MLMMLIGYPDQKWPDDAHDARRVSLDLIKRVQLMLMMLAGPPDLIKRAQLMLRMLVGYVLS